MTSQPAGSRLGPYQIVAPLGAGGMGEVFRARDTTLEREVAIKVLPAAFAQDAERVARFRREAQLLASLNHPNIAAIYGLEESGGGVALALELVEGEDLAERLKRGALPVDEALAIAKQIAEGLEAAHEKGIVHRDLKPANIKLTQDGTVKILDFGLAKAFAGDAATASSSGLSQSPTLLPQMTEAGLILGTAAYMSPEQARGKPVDKRADIWSFGVVFYEMLTGQRLFGGETATDLLAAVVRQEIEWSRLPPGLSTRAAVLLKRCLDREARTRLRDIGEARVALAESTEPEDGRKEAKGAPLLTRRSFAVGSALLGAGAVLGFATGRRFGREGAASTGAAALKVTRVTASGNVIEAAISPDGRYLAYVESDQGQQSLWLRQLASGQTLRLIPERGVFYWGHTFSPDGNSVVFGLKTPDDGAGGIFAISALGGTARRLVTGIDSAPAYSPDGKRMAYVRNRFPSVGESALMVAAADGSGEKALAVFQLPEFVAGIFFAGPTWSPDGSRIVTAAARLGSATSEARSRLVSVSTADGSVSVFSDPDWLFAGQAGFLPGGRGLLAIARAAYQPNPQVWFVASGGAALPLTNDLNDYRIISLTQDGRSLVTVTGDLSSAIWVEPREGGGKPRRLTWAKLDGVNGLAFAPDGRIVYTAKDGDLWSLWSMTADGAERAPLFTAGPEEVVLAPAVSGNGDVFATVRTRSGVEVRLIRADGTIRGTVVREIRNDLVGVSRDGKNLVYGALVGGGPRLFRLDPAGGDPEPVTDRVAFTPTIEPSGRRVAFYYVDDDRRYRIGVVSLADGRLTWSAAAEPPTTSSRLLLREDGIFVNTVAGDRANVWQLRLDGGAPRKITAFEDQLVFDFALSDDGRTLAVARGPRTRDALLITGFTGPRSGIA